MACVICEWPSYTNEPDKVCDWKLLGMLVEELAYLRPGVVRTKTVFRVKCLGTYHGMRSISISYGAVSGFPMGGSNHSGLAFIVSTVGQMRY